MLAVIQYDNRVRGDPPPHSTDEETVVCKVGSPRW